MKVTAPPLGFNTWNTFGKNINEQLIREIADCFADTGLKDAGYTYIVIDDCWAEMERDPQSGSIVPDKQKFPSGMKALGDYIHAKGLKFGMYSCSGVRTCGGYPGSFGHEYLDARDFASYGCDLLKYDFCFRPSTVQSHQLYRKMGMALRSTGRDIVYSVCTGGMDHPEKWARAVGGHMYRSTLDISDSFDSFKNIALGQAKNLNYSAPGCFNDLDMLTVGMYGNGNVADGGCTEAEYRTQFLLWCMFGTPLMLGCDPRTLSPELRSLVTNKKLIAINQDPECRPAFEASAHPWIGGRKAYFRFLANGEYALCLANLSDSDGEVPFYTYSAGLDKDLSMQFEDLVTGEIFTPKKDYFGADLPAHTCALYRVKITN
jgi:alpha-galactosidase